ncbi:MAG TPA: MATE family efflux transporter [Gaiellaceae bacterium]|nr:MATE family efflux transporter [Gaiellaceae bacterium]
MRLRSHYDGEILRLAVPALGALAAEPLYILVDTAIVGHLGRPELAALGIAATMLTALFAIFNFLQYGTTAQVGRASGAGEEEAARRLGGQAVWLSLGVGVALAALVVALAPQLVRLMGGEGEAGEHAVTYMRIAALGLPFAFIALGGQGYLRGIADLRTPLVILVAGNSVNAVLDVVFVYGLDWGIAGSAWATAVSQAGMGVAFLVLIAERAGVGLRPHLASMLRLVRVGRHIFIRTAALMAAFTLAGAIITRFGDASIAAHQIAFQLWLFLALTLDAIAIAGQVLVGRGLGAGDTERAYAASVRMIWLSVYAGLAFAGLLLLLEPLLPRIFTSDALVLERAGAIWLLFALMQPLNGAVFALDGILIGAGDGPFLAGSMVAAFLVSAGVALTAYVLDWGIVGVWAALVVLICVRLALMLWRFSGRRWLVTGWSG